MLYLKAYTAYLLTTYMIQVYLKIRFEFKKFFHRPKSMQTEGFYYRFMQKVHYRLLRTRKQDSLNKTGSKHGFRYYAQILKIRGLSLDSREIDTNKVNYPGRGEHQPQKQTVRHIIADLVKSIGIKRQVAFTMIVSDIITKSLSWGEVASMIYATYK